MKRTKHSPAQIEAHLRKVEALTANGATASEAVKSIGVSEQTYYRWKKKYGGMDKQDVRRLKDLERENARLKKLLAEQVLDNAILKEAAEGNF